LPSTVTLVCAALNDAFAFVGRVLRTAFGHCLSQFCPGQCGFEGLLVFGLVDVAIDKPGISRRTVHEQHYTDVMTMTAASIEPHVNKPIHGTARTH
jgi:hypothetical protein